MGFILGGMPMVNTVMCMLLLKNYSELVKTKYVILFE